MEYGLSLKLDSHRQTNTLSWSTWKKAPMWKSGASIIKINIQYTFSREAYILKVKKEKLQNTGVVKINQIKKEVVWILLRHLLHTYMKKILTGKNNTKRNQKSKTKHLLRYVKKYIWE